MPDESALQAKQPAQKPPQALGGPYHHDTHTNARLPSLRLYFSIWRNGVRGDSALLFLKEK